MNDVADDRVGPMLNPPHLGVLIREIMDDVGGNVTETAARLDRERRTLSRLLNGKVGVSANTALALEEIGWGTAEHWMRMQASYDLAQARRKKKAFGKTAHVIELCTVAADKAVSHLIKFARFGKAKRSPVQSEIRPIWPDDLA